MRTWIFQGNPKIFNVDDYLLENQFIWWSIRQAYYAKDINIGDEVYIWRSDGNNRGSGGIVARTLVNSPPQYYTNDDRSKSYWHENITDEPYLAVELKVIEVIIENGIKRYELMEHDELSDLKILRLKQNTNYLVDDQHANQLRQLWFSHVSSYSNDKDSEIKKPNDYAKDYKLPPLQFSGRDREFNYYSDELKAKVIFEHLVNNKTHRWLDKNVLGITSGNTNGRNSANILYYLGMKANYRGIFQGEELKDVIKILKAEGELYKDAVRLLMLLEDDLENSIKSDIEAERVEEGQGIEGRVKYYYGKRYERDSKNRMLAIKIHGLDCYACGFNFEKVYGERGKDFIEIHHMKPLSTLEEEVEIDPETDLIPLCANCHRMVHRRRDDVLDVETLKSMIKQ